MKSSSAVAPSPEALRSLVAASLDGAVVVDRRGVVLFANPAAMRMARPEGVALVGTDFGHSTSDEDMAEVEFAETGTVAEMRVSPLIWEGGPARLVMLRDVTARRRSSERRELAEALLDQAERVAGLGSLEHDLSSGRIVCTSGWDRIYGRRLDAKSFLSDPRRVAELVVHPDDREHWLEAVDCAFVPGASVDTEYRVVRPDGEVRTVHLVVEPVNDENGRPIKNRGTIQDITEQRRAEESRRETYRLLEAIADNTLAAIAVKDLDGRYLFSNAAYEQVLGRSHEELLGSSVYDVLPRRTADLIMTREREVLATGAPTLLEERLEVVEGNLQTWLSTRFPILDDAGRPYAVGVVVMDVTELDRARAALHESEERFRLLAENSQDVVYLIRLVPEPLIEYVSPAARDLLGIPPEELTGAVDAVIARLQPEDRPLARRLMGATEPIVTQLHRPDRSTIWAEIRIVPICDDTGRTVALEGNIRDITRRVEAEHERERLVRRLEQAERLDTLGRLAGGVAHDVNNLLAVILGTAEFLAEDLPPDDPRLADVRRISQTAQRGAAMTRQLLIFSRREPSSPEPLDLNEVVTRLEDVLRRTIGEDVDFRTDLSPAIEAVNADRSRIEQVVLNLVVNARAAMPQGGRITVRTDAVSADHELPPVSGGLPPVPPGEYVRLTVSDTGEGMTPEVARHAFEPFFTTRERGRGGGLGLATVHGVITEARGHIVLDSEPGRGTTFQIYLPACPERPVPAPDAAGHPPRGRGETVLVVEDEEEVRQVVTRILARNHYRLLTACDATEALKICGDHATRIDLLLTNVIMPGMSGFELGERVRAMRPGLPVLYMSGYEEDRRQAGAGRAGAERARGMVQATLSKPFEAATVLRRIKEALDGPGGQDR